MKSNIAKPKRENLITIITYHYVRDISNSRYKKIKGRTIDTFKRQIKYIKNNYTPIGINELISILDEGEKLRANAILLTFDDGYIDHYTNVFPILDDHKISGTFFPSGEAITDRKVLDVNKIHFLLASVENTTRLIHEIYEFLDEYRQHYSLESNESYYSRLAHPNAYDTADVIFVKRLLQRELPEPVRLRLINRLFSQYVTADEESFASELYMNIDQMRCMKRHGMFFGSHGYSHYWMDSLSSDKQEEDIKLSLSFLKNIGEDTDNWIMCYPYGGYNKSLLNVLRNNGCRFGFTTHHAVANIVKDDPLLLPRIDTNEIPVE